MRLPPPMIEACKRWRQGDAMEAPQQGPAPIHAIDEVPGIDRLEPLDAYQDQVLDLIRSGLADGTDVLAISGAVADANDSLTRRLLELAQAHLGAPAWRYRWLALGSHGRREQVLSSDQDHAIAYEPPGPPAERAAAHAYFLALADLMVPALARAGIPLCPGGYMATIWCRPLDEYELLFRSWVREPQPKALLEAEVFLDIRACHGDLPVDVLERILLAGGSHGPFRVQMARAAVAFRPPFSRLGRLRNGAPVDVKLGGTAAIVLLARLYALSAGSTEHGTVARLLAASAAGMLSISTATSLVEAYRFLTDLRLRHQVEQVTTGTPADNLISVDRLTIEQRQRLRTTLRLVRDMQDVTAMRYATSSVT